MSYKVSPGIPEAELSSWLKKAGKENGTFEDGRVDYTNAHIAPIVMGTLVCKKQFLLVKRGYGLADAEGYWSTVNGFIDEDKPVKEIARQELSEELGLEVQEQDIKVAKSYTMQNPREKRSYIVFPFLAVVGSVPPIVLDREHTDFKWISRSELESYHILDDLPRAIDSALELL